VAQRDNTRTEGPDSLDVDDIAVWKRAVDALVRGGAELAEAIDGANLIVQVERRKRAEAAAKPMRSSGVRKRSRSQS
jgi:hypothetical protein